MIAAILAVIAMSCAQSEVVNAETGQVVQESNSLKGRRYHTTVAPSSVNMGVMEYKRGGMTYLFIEGSTGLCAVNYTLDSIELSYHQDETGPIPQEEIPKTSNTNLTGVWR